MIIDIIYAYINLIKLINLINKIINIYNLLIIDVYIIELIINRTINKMTSINEIYIHWIIKIYYELL